MAAANDNCEGKQQRWWMMTEGDDDCLQDWVVDYNGEGLERVACDGGDSGVVMMAVAKMAAAEDSSSGQ